MGDKAFVFSVAGIFIMLSFFSVMVGALLFVNNIDFIPALVVGLVMAWIGFYSFGVGFELE